MKDAYYFSHDSNASKDPKIMSLIMAQGMKGYGIYWRIIEILRESGDYMLSLCDCNAIAYDLHCEVIDVESVIKNYALFEINGEDKFWSQSLVTRMEKVAERSEKARTSALKRWDSMRTQCEPNAIKESKVKESKGNIDYSQFEKLTLTSWNSLCSQYPTLKAVRNISAERRGHLKKRFANKDFKDNWQVILDAIPKYSFLLGENDRKWSIDFDWLIKNDTNYVKVLEGKYSKTTDGIPQSMKQFIK